MVEKKILLEIRKEFSFEAAHYFEHEVSDHPFHRLHGHSFKGVVFIKGDTKEKTGWIRDFWKIEEIIKTIVTQVDHQLLNKVSGLERPSLEQIAFWFLKKLQPLLPGLYAIEISRPSCGETAIARYEDDTEL